MLWLQPFPHLCEWDSWTWISGCWSMVLRICIIKMKERSSQPIVPAAAGFSLYANVLFVRLKPAAETEDVTRWWRHVSPTKRCVQMNRSNRLTFLDDGDASRLHCVLLLIQHRHIIPVRSCQLSLSTSTTVNNTNFSSMCHRNTKCESLYDTQDRLEALLAAQHFVAVFQHVLHPWCQWWDPSHSTQHHLL